MIENGDGSALKVVIVIKANPKGDWNVDFAVPPMVALFLMEQVKLKILTSQFKQNENSQIIKPSASDIQKVDP